MVTRDCCRGRVGDVGVLPGWPGAQSRAHAPGEIRASGRRGAWPVAPGRSGGATRARRVRRRGEKEGEDGRVGEEGECWFASACASKAYPRRGAGGACESRRRIRTCHHASVGSAWPMCGRCESGSDCIVAMCLSELGCVRRSLYAVGVSCSGTLWAKVFVTR